MLASISDVDNYETQPFYFMTVLTYESPLMSKIEHAGYDEGFLLEKPIEKFYEFDIAIYQAVVRISVAANSTKR